MKLGRVYMLGKVLEKSSYNMRLALFFCAATSDSTIFLEHASWYICGNINDNRKILIRLSKMKQKGILRRVARQTVLNGSPVYIIYTLIRFSICLQNTIHLYFNLFLVGFSAQEKDGITHFKTNSAGQSLQASSSKRRNEYNPWHFKLIKLISLLSQDKCNY